jgi:hypothetical protein
VLRTYKIASNEISTLRIELIRRGLTMPRLAKEMAIDYRNLRNQIAAGRVRDRIAHRIEQFLGLPVFNSLEEFRRRSSVNALAGCDLWLALLPQLRGLATQFRVRGRSRLKHRLELLEAIAAHVVEIQSIKNEKTEQNH